MKSERQIEEAVCSYAQDEGLTQYKFVSPNNRGVPDRIFLYRGMALFIEFKAEGYTGGYDPLQQKHRDNLVWAGCTVILVNDINQGRAIIDDFIGSVDQRLNFYDQI